MDEAAVGSMPWKILGYSVKGAKHRRSNLGNQDAIRWYPKLGDCGRVALSVADGHGSTHSFRSARGAELATRVSESVALELFEVVDSAALSLINERLINSVPRYIKQQWREAVTRDIADNPFSEEELSLVGEFDPYVTYGTTLVSVVISEQFIAAWQIGDGDITVIDEHGNCSWLLPQREKLLGNDVRSLSDPIAERHFQVGLFGTIPPMVIVSTDGLSNSYEDDEAFLKFSSDLYKIAVYDGFEVLEENMLPWLDKLTESGSGDDITVGISANACISGSGDKYQDIEP
jgi:Protein phosphatase 2C